MGRFGGGRPVIDRRADQLVDAGRLKLPNRDPGGDQDRLAAQLRTVAEGDVAVGALRPDPLDLLGGDDLGAEPLGLGDRPPGQIGA